MTVQLTSDQAAALDRLFAIAQQDTGTSGRVANFLLAWWNARDNGGFDFTDFWSMDPPILRDCLTVLGFILNARCYLDSDPKYSPLFREVHRAWRPQKKRRRK